MVKEVRKELDPEKLLPFLGSDLSVSHPTWNDLPESWEVGKPTTMRMGDRDVVLKCCGSGRDFPIIFTHEQAESMGGLVVDYYDQLTRAGLNTALLVSALPLPVDVDDSGKGYYLGVLQERVAGMPLDEIIASDLTSVDKAVESMAGLFDAVRIVTRAEVRKGEHVPQSPTDSPIMLDVKPHNFLLEPELSLCFVDLFLPWMRDANGDNRVFQVKPDLFDMDPGFKTLNYRLGDKAGLYTKALLECCALRPEARPRFEKAAHLYLRFAEDTDTSVKVIHEIEHGYPTYLARANMFERERFKALGIVK